MPFKTPPTGTPPTGQWELPLPARVTTLELLSPGFTLTGQSTALACLSRDYDSPSPESWVSDVAL